MRNDISSEELGNLLSNSGASAVTALNQPQLDILRHALGIVLGRSSTSESGRNHFVTGADGTDHGICMSLVELGMMQHHAGKALSGGDDVVVVTAAGRIAARPKPAEFVRATRSQRGYDRFLRADESMTFGQWLKTSAAA